MRITIVTGPFNPLPPAGCGAVERRWHDVGRDFAESGHHVTFLSRSHPSQVDEMGLDGRLRYVRRIKFNRSRFLSLDLLKDAIYSLGMTRALPAADILITNTFWLPVFARMKPDAGKIVVNVARMPKKQIRLYLKADRLSVVSNAVKNRLLAQCPAASRIVKVIPNPIDTYVFKPPAAERSYSGKKDFLYAGRIHPEKGLLLLIRAFRRVFQAGGDVRLTIGGPASVQEGGGGAGYLAMLKQEASGLPVKFSEPVYEKSELARIYQQAHVFCYPSLADEGESFGVAPLEAMATGLPTVVSSLDCFRDFVEPGKTGFCFDHTAEDAEKQLYRQLRALAVDPDLAARIGRMAARRAEAYSTETIAEKYLQDFEEILENAKTS